MDEHPDSPTVDQLADGEPDRLSIVEDRIGRLEAELDALRRARATLMRRTRSGSAAAPAHPQPPWLGAQPDGSPASGPGGDADGVRVAALGLAEHMIAGGSSRADVEAWLRRTFRGDDAAELVASLPTGRSPRRYPGR